MDQAEALAHERRARLAAERLLKQKEEELSAANRKLSQHAKALSFEIIEKREEVAEVREENSRVHCDLEMAQNKVLTAERRLWTALTTIKDGFALFGADETLVAANPAWLSPFDGVDAIAAGTGYAQILQVAIEEGVIDIGGERPSVWKARMLDRWRAERIEPMVIRLWNGAWIKLIDRRGEGGDMVSLALNITATMRNEARLKEARRKAEAASRAKSAFLANMSHELRTPMNGVVGMADLLIESDLKDEQMACVETIKTSGEALLVMINDVLDFSKLDAGRMVLHAEEFDLEALIHEVVHMIQPQAQVKGIGLMVDYDMFLPTRYSGDRGRLWQVLTNLIGNAVKFTETGHVLVRATGMEQEGEPHQVHLSIEDTGIGIDAEMQDRVFSEFTQVEDARNRKFEGTGLGLAISRRLVRLMGGEIWLDSEPGRGSVFGFSVALPALEPVEEPPGHLAGELAILVDSDRAEAGVLANQLRSLGLKVDVKSEATPADIPPETALVFVAVPDSDDSAVTLARALEETGRSLPVVALTAQRARPAPGLAGSLARPVRRAALCALLLHLGKAPPEPAEGSAPAIAARQMRVLAAEDNATNRLVLSKMLKPFDLELRFAGDGHEAVALHAEWQPDMIFMDISMPGMDGREATRHIRAVEEGTGRHTPIVALTAHALSGDEAEILAAGLDHYLTKPLKKQTILERLCEACSSDCRPIEPPESAAAVAMPTPEPALDIGFQSRRARLAVAT